MTSLYTSTHRDGLLVTELKRLDAPDDLVHIPADASGVVEAEHELVLGVDDEDRPDGEGELLLVAAARVDHAVLDGDGAILVADDRELDLDLVLAVGDDVLDPLLVAPHGVDGQGGHEASHLAKLVVFEREPADFGRAHGGEVGGVAEQDGPFALLPLVEGGELALGRVHGEVGDDVPQTQAAVGGFLFGLPLKRHQSFLNIMFIKA